MKITRVHATWLRVPIAPERQHVSDFGRAATFDTALVRIDTDVGLTGWGEAKVAAGSSGNYAGVCAVVNHEFGPALVGQDARDITRHWGVAVQRHARPLRARARPCVSGDEPARRLDLGAVGRRHRAVGPARQVARRAGVAAPRRAPRRVHAAYASGGWADATGIGALPAQGYIAQGGFGAVKMRVGVFDGSPQASAEASPPRAALGPGVELMCDAHGTFTVSEARQFCHLVRDCNLAWFEEPVTADDKRSLAEVRRGTHIAIAAGEQMHTRFDFRDLIDLRAADILQPDPPSAVA